MPSLKKNHKQANYSDMEDSIRDSSGEERLDMFKGVLLEQFLVIAKDRKRNSNKLMAKIIKANKMWRYFCREYPITESEQEIELEDSSLAVECEYVNGDMYCAMLLAIRVEHQVLKESYMCLDIDREDIVLAAEWLEESSGEKFNSEDLLDGLLGDAA